MPPWATQCAYASTATATTMTRARDAQASREAGGQRPRWYFLTAQDSSGRSTDVIHSNATRILGWEKFTFNSLGGGYYDIQVADGHYLTAVGGGGKSSGDTLHTDATRVGSWETFRVTCGL